MKVGHDLMAREGIWQRRATGVVLFFLGGGNTILLTFKVQEFKYMLALGSNFLNED